jgi:hypothetical protein
MLLLICRNWLETQPLENPYTQGVARLFICIHFILSNPHHRSYSVEVINQIIDGKTAKLLSGDYSDFQPPKI